MNDFASPGVWITTPLGALRCYSCNRVPETAVLRPSWLPGMLDCPPLLVAQGGVGGGHKSLAIEVLFLLALTLTPLQDRQLDRGCGPARHCACGAHTVITFWGIVLGDTTSFKTTQSLGQAARGCQFHLWCHPSLPRAPAAYTLLSLLRSHTILTPPPHHALRIL